MVGVGDGEENALAQVVIVNSYGNIIYNKYVKSSERVVDFRTNISGIRPEHIANGRHSTKRISLALLLTLGSSFF